MFSGVTYDIDISKDAGERITNLLLDGEAIVDTETYKLAVNNYRLGTLMGKEWVTSDDVYYDSYTELQDAGRIRDMIGVYLNDEKAGLATPSVDNNWKIIGADLEHPLKDAIYEMIIAGDILIPKSEDGRTYNVKAVNVYELMQDGIIDQDTLDANEITDTYAELTIMHTNDMHGFFKYGKYDGMGAALMATKIKEVRAAKTNTLLLDGGDGTQGNNFVNLTKGENAVIVMNALGYDAMAAGNHEFDNGSDRLLELKELLEFPVLAANIKDSEGEDFLMPYTIKEMDGFKVAIFGLSTPETAYKAHPKYTEGLTFEDPATVAAAMVTELEPLADIIIAVAHVGNEGDYTTEAIATAVPGIDVIIDGHSHTEYENGLLVGDTLIVQAEEKTKNLGMATLTIVNGEVVYREAMMYTKSEATETTPDAAMEALIAELDEVNAPIENEVVGTTAVVLDGERADVRTGETNLGNLVAEALKYYGQADLALTNGGGIRTSIDVGDVTKGEILTVLPFSNTVRVIELTGADVKAAIEHGIDEYPEAKGAFPHIAGMTVEYDATKEAGSRVTKIMVGDELIDDTKTYTLATNDFLVAGGDGYEMFEGKKVVKEAGTMDQVVIDYMNEVGPEKGKVDGRMKEISNETSYFSVNEVA
jgi:2',3'-cyclic-nucleotide 2'-phosphodiesterase (5'-nucleotidase family)